MLWLSLKLWHHYSNGNAKELCLQGTEFNRWIKRQKESGMYLSSLFYPWRHKNKTWEITLTLPSSNFPIPKITRQKGEMCLLKQNQNQTARIGFRATNKKKCDQLIFNSDRQKFTWITILPIRLNIACGTLHLKCRCQKTCRVINVSA